MLAAGGGQEGGRRDRSRARGRACSRTWIILDENTGDCARGTGAGSAQ